jgi:hypothetical protein
MLPTEFLEALDFRQAVDHDKIRAAVREQYRRVGAKAPKVIKLAGEFNDLVSRDWTSQAWASMRWRHNYLLGDFPAWEPSALESRGYATWGCAPKALNAVIDALIGVPRAAP